MQPYLKHSIADSPSLDGTESSQKFCKNYLLKCAAWENPPPKVELSLLYSWQREDAEARQKELIEEVRLLHITKSDAVNKLESLYGLPEKLVRQVNYIITS